MEKPGRHRLVRLADLVDFQHRQQERRHAALNPMARDATSDGLYAATDDAPRRGPADWVWHFLRFSTPAGCIGPTLTPC
jgi:hypothetical protein